MNSGRCCSITYVQCQEEYLRFSLSPGGPAVARSAVWISSVRAWGHFNTLAFGRLKCPLSWGDPTTYVTFRNWQSDIHTKPHASCAEVREGSQGLNFPVYLSFYRSWHNYFIVIVIFHVNNQVQHYQNLLPSKFSQEYLQCTEIWMSSRRHCQKMCAVISIFKLYREPLLF